HRVARRQNREDEVGCSDLLVGGGNHARRLGPLDGLGTAPLERGEHLRPWSVSRLPTAAPIAPGAITATTGVMASLRLGISGFQVKSCCDAHPLARLSRRLATIHF